jgi:hypothetical protein
MTSGATTIARVAEDARPRSGASLPKARCILAQGQVRAAAMVIGEMRAQEAPEMRLIENDHVIEILAPNGSDQALDVGTLPGTEWTRDDFGDPDAGHPPTRRLVVDAVVVSREPPWGDVLGERFDQVRRRARTWRAYLFETGMFNRSARTTFLTGTA